MIHAALGRAITNRAFHAITVKGAFDLIEKGYLIHWLTGWEVYVALGAGLALTVVLLLMFNEEAL